VSIWILADAENKKVRGLLAKRLSTLLKERGVSKSKVDRFIEIPQLNVTALVNYQLNRFSAERLLHVITLLDQDKEMFIRPKSTKHHHGVVQS
jgi:predicted XRE-type DNA-binding protein